MENTPAILETENPRGKGVSPVIREARDKFVSTFKYLNKRGR